ncbi:dephospho-CoA kinase [Solibacillus sp. R5-41]|uniref:GrpB family protein n=1 Tax=Solibacillus sp. R5-41 TaxID=2048654 RepID=UPI000C126E35|nr:GrpB family protein [Solibacillus sp. R5-41]ATP42127.1 dephospho-CoA kinase [Solibacillus sp. R5-41]
MRLGLNNDEVLLVPYDEAWKVEFTRIQDELLSCTKLTSNQIEHIGSTSIEGIRAKPIIDILVGVENLETLERPFFKDLEKAGFYKLRVVRPNEIVCAKFFDETFQVKTHFIHIVQYESVKWQQLIFFRDYLKRNEEAKKQYEHLKESFFQTDLSGINSYTDYKEQFVKSIFEKMKL